MRSAMYHGEFAAEAFPPASPDNIAAFSSSHCFCTYSSTATGRTQYIHKQVQRFFFRPERLRPKFADKLFSRNFLARKFFGRCFVSAKLFLAEHFFSRKFSRLIFFSKEKHWVNKIVSLKYFRPIFFGRKLLWPNVFHLIFFLRRRPPQNVEKKERI